MIDDPLYSSEYFSGYGYGIDLLRAKAYQQEYQQIASRIAPGRVFDYGCGCGDFLSVWDDRWEKHGWDISAYARERALEKDIDIIHPLNVSFPGYFDVVVFRGTIQHIDDPVGALRDACYMLRSGGLLAIIATPNTESLIYQLFHDLPALDPPRNWFIPGAHELINVLHNIGFTQIEARYPYWDSPYAMPLRDAARFAMRLFGVKRSFAWPGNMMEIYATLP